jgi:hypothetical protein
MYVRFNLAKYGFGPFHVLPWFSTLLSGKQSQNLFCTLQILNLWICTSKSLIRFHDKSFSGISNLISQRAAIIAVTRIHHRKTPFPSQLLND